MRPLGLAAVLVSLASLGCANRGATAYPSEPPGSQPIAVGPEGPVAPPVSDDEPEPARDGPWVSAATASDFVLAHQSDQAFGVWVDMPRSAAAGHVPTALTLVMDTSGSMRGDKIVNASEAAARLVNELEDGDHVSIVTFSDHARELVRPTVIDHESRRLALAVIEELSADGGTAMHEGLKLAESQLWSTPDTHLVRRMVVVSDGKATVGPTAPDELGRIAEVGLQRGIQVTS